MISGIKKTLIGTTGLVVALSGFAFASPAMADDTPSNTTLGPGAYSGVTTDDSTTSNDDWSCDMFSTGTFAPCVQNTPTTGDEAWQKGYKLTFNWETPLDQSGNPFERCVLSYYNPQTAYSPKSLAPIQIDVPASWGTYTIPLTRYGWLEDGITAGATTLTEEYYCYTNGVGASARTDSDSAIIPDMPPTTPTNVDATTDDSNVAQNASTVTVETGGTDLDSAATTTNTDTSVDLLVSGSKALGVSPLDGYQLDLTNDNTGATVADVNIAPKVAAGASRFVAAASKSSKVLNAAKSTVKNLKPGTYTLRVASYNKIGVSNPYTVKLVVKKGGKIAAVKHVTASAKGTKVTAKWAASKGATGYVVQALKGSKIVKQVTVSAKAHSALVKLAKGTYKLRVASLDGKRAGTPSVSTVRVR